MNDAPTPFIYTININEHMDKHAEANRSTEGPGRTPKTRYTILSYTHIFKSESEHLFLQNTFARGMNDAPTPFIYIININEHMDKHAEAHRSTEGPGRITKTRYAIT